MSQAPLDMDTPPVPKKRKKAVRHEDAIQKACVQWLRIRRKKGDIQFAAINPNPMKKTVQQRDRDYALGVEAGPPDLVILYWDRANGRRKAVWCELKSAKGTTTDAQEDWGEWLRAAGFEYHVIRSADALAALFP